MIGDPHQIVFIVRVFRQTALRHSQRLRRIGFFANPDISLHRGQELALWVALLQSQNQFPLALPVRLQRCLRSQNIFRVRQRLICEFDLLVPVRNIIGIGGLWRLRCFGRCVPGRDGILPDQIRIFLRFGRLQCRESGIQVMPDRAPAEFCAVASTLSHCFAAE